MLSSNYESFKSSLTEFDRIFNIWMFAINLLFLSKKKLKKIIDLIAIEKNFGKNLILEECSEIIAMFLRTFLPYSHSVTYCFCFCVHSSSTKERVGGGYYCIRRVLGRHLAWYWSRNARILVRRARVHTYIQSHALEGETHEFRSVCEFFRCKSTGEETVLKMAPRPVSFVNIKKIFLFFWSYVSICVFSYLFARIGIERYL